jgi:uncharacterized cupredoxin-like copper-binding protein
LRELGATPLHRRSFGLVRQIVAATEESELVFEEIGAGESFESHPPEVESGPVLTTQHVVELPRSVA